MGLSCLFGHDFGDPTHREERERHGEEVVLTRRNVETCRHCGTERVLAENTVVMQHDAARNPSDPERSSADPAAGTDEAEPPTRDVGDAAGKRTRDGGGTVASASATTDGVEVGSGGEGGDEPPVTDDAVILTDGSTEERSPTEWPDFAGGDTRTGQSPAADDGQPPGTADGNSDGTGFETTRDRPKLRCENCATAWDPMSSLLAGDLCPNCRITYLTDGS